MQKWYVLHSYSGEVNADPEIPAREGSAEQKILPSVSKESSMYLCLFSSKNIDGKEMDFLELFSLCNAFLVCSSTIKGKGEQRLPNETKQGRSSMSDLILYVL